VLGDERAAIPIGSYHRAFGVTLSLPSVLGRQGIVAVFEPKLTAEEQAGLEKSAHALRTALKQTGA
jgi:L-lactate dehydrogenase